MMAAFKVLTKF